MTEEKTLGLEEARKIVEAILEATRKSEGRPMAAAVVDIAGDLIYFARMDGAAPVTATMAINKAYTVIRWGRDTIVSHKMIKDGRDVAWFGDSRLAPIPGGVAIRSRDNTIIGAVGTSGRIALEPMGDEELARIGAKTHLQ